MSTLNLDRSSNDAARDGASHAAGGRLPTWLRQLGLPGVLGAALLGGSAWFIAQELPRRADTLAQAESDVRRLRHALIARTQAAAAERADAAAGQQAVVAPEQAWARLWSSLPDASQRLGLQARVLASAAELGLQPATVQWQGESVNWTRGEQAAVGAAGLWRQRMSMPVQAPYPVLRTWLDRLQREPALSIDALDIQRTELGSDEVTAQVGLSLWWRQAAPPSGKATP